MHYFVVYSLRMAENIVTRHHPRFSVTSAFMFQQDSEVSGEVWYMFHIPAEAVFITLVRIRTEVT